MYVPTSRSRRRVYVSILDIVWALISPLIALYLGGALVLAAQNWSMVAIYCALASSFAIVAFLAFRLQDSITQHFSAHEAIDIAEAVLFAELMTCGFLFTLTRLDGIPRSIPLYHGLMLAGGLILVRIAMRIALSGREGTADYHARCERVIVIGANRLASAFIRLVGTYAPNQQSVVAVLDEKSSMIGRGLGGVQVLGTPQELDAMVGEFAVHGIKVDRVIIAGESNLLSSAALHDVERVCRKRHIALSFLPRMLGLTEHVAHEVAPVAATTQIEPPDTRGVFLRLKRVIDVVGALALMLLLLPLLLIASVLVLFDVGAPVLFWQERTGWKGRPFLIYKYRTLRAPFDGDGRPAVGDRHPSAIGRFLRATRIDELPQLINVLFGDMSLIGPRPLLPEDQPANSAMRLSVRPGITGWAQVNGAKLVAKEDKEKFDEWYIRNASLLVDLKIVMMTLRILSTSYLKSAEASADLEQVQAKRENLTALAPAGEADAIARDRDAAQPPRHGTVMAPPVRHRMARRSA
jgi:lipopolysaccharide/colanic/teichoic acid biosynthesis glycosyltransferase